MEKELLQRLNEIDGLLGRCTNPALTRDEHDVIRKVMSVVKVRVELSFKQEKELRELKEVAKDEKVNDKVEAESKE